MHVGVCIFLLDNYRFSSNNTAGCFIQVFVPSSQGEKGEMYNERYTYIGGNVL